MTTMTAPSSADVARVTPASSERRAVRGASLGFFIDMFDIYLPVIVLAPAMAYFIPASISDGARGILTGLIFASTLVARPLGSVLFGHLGDRIGRKRATVMAVAGAGVGTGLIALLPGYETIGLLAVVLLIAIRFVDGVFLGGEYTGAVPLAMEHSRIANRGRNAGLIAFGFPASYVVISLLTLGVLMVAPAGDVSAAYTQWGWRIPFAVGAVISIAFAVYYSRAVDESPVWEREVKVGAVRRNPLKELVGGPHRASLAQAFLLMTGVWFSSNAAIVILPPTIAPTTGLSPVQVSLALVLAFVVVAVAYPLLGMLAQRVGRRIFFMGCGVASFLVVPLFVLFASAGVTSFWGVTALVAAIALLGVPAFGAIGAYMSERFPVAIRSTGYGVGYSLALIVPSFYAFYTGALSELMPAQFTPTVLLAVGGACMLVAGWWSPETRDVDLGPDGV